MDDDNWLTVGKPKKIKTGEKKVVNNVNGEKVKRQQFCPCFQHILVFFE